MDIVITILLLPISLFCFKMVKFFYKMDQLFTENVQEEVKPKKRGRKPKCQEPEPEIDVVVMPEQLSSKEVVNFYSVVCCALANVLLPKLGYAVDTDKLKTNLTSSKILESTLSNISGFKYMPSSPLMLPLITAANTYDCVYKPKTEEEPTCEDYDIADDYPRNRLCHNINGTEA